MICRNDVHGTCPGRWSVAVGVGRSDVCAKDSKQLDHLPMARPRAHVHGGGPVKSCRPVRVSPSLQIQVRIGIGIGSRWWVNPPKKGAVQCYLLGTVVAGACTEPAPTAS
jgi:hypothetical protein